MEIVGGDGKDRFFGGGRTGKFGGLFGGWCLACGFEIIRRDIEEQIDIDGAEVALNGDKFVVGGEGIAHACGRHILGGRTRIFGGDTQIGCGRILLWRCGLLWMRRRRGGQIMFGAFERRDQADFNAIMILHPSEGMAWVLEKEVPDICRQAEFAGHVCVPWRAKRTENRGSMERLACGGKVGVGGAGVCLLCRNGVVVRGVCRPIV